VVGIVDPATLHFRYACAGHRPPLLASADGTFTALPGSDGDLPLGALPHHVTNETTVILPVDGLLALYTNGCIEMNNDAESGARAFGEALVEARTLKPTRAAIAIDRAIFGSRERNDDAAIVTIAPEPTLEHIDVQLPAEPASAPLARNALRRFFAASSLDERRTYDSLVAAGEAVASAIERARDGRPHQTIHLRARYEGASCAVFVEDTGTWRHEDDEAPENTLAMIRRLSDECSIDHGANGTSVMLRFTIAPRLADAALVDTAAR
jgi:serine/threonine-protein kinase RsbW